MSILFGYESQKMILQYMEPNQRIQLSVRCPSIRITEKLVPLRIDHLAFGEMRTEINGTTYQLGVYRNYPPETPTPNIHSKENEEGGSQTDLDEFGRIVFSAGNTVTPGDVDLFRERRRNWTVLEEERSHEQFKRNFEFKLQQGERYLQIIVAIVPGADELEAHQEKISFLENTVSKSRLQLQPYYYKRDNVPLPYTFLLQSAIKTEKGTTYERFQYNHQLHEAHKYLNTVLFGGREFEIQVKKLLFLDNRFIYRFPVGFKLRAKTIESGHIDFQLLDQIINPESYSTMSLIITDCPRNTDVYTQPAVKMAKSLDIDNRYPDNDIPDFQILKGLQAERVTLRREIKLSRHSRLVKHWLEDGKPIGVIYTFGLREEESCKKCLRTMKVENAAKMLRDEKRFLTFSMPSGNSQLRVYYERVLPQPEEYHFDWSHWKLILRVEGI